MERKLSKDQIVRQIAVFFGRDRSHLREEIRSFVKDRSNWIHLESLLQERTKQGVRGSVGISSEVEDNVDDPGIDWFSIGDLSVQYEIVLNKGVTKFGRERYWDKRLAARCGGTAHICDVWVSLLLPLFTMDCYYMTYNRRKKYYEFGPYRPESASEKKAVKEARQVMKEKGFSFVTKKFAKRKIRNAITDLNPDGNAKVFDCLFSDVWGYEEEQVRLSDDEPIPDILPGIAARWREYYRSRGKLLKREITRYFPSGDVETTITDAKHRITSVRISRRFGGELFLDVEKRMKQQREKHPKRCSPHK
jgi:hypothetical protein